jgi:hypothetical protein
MLFIGKEIGTDYCRTNLPRAGRNDPFAIWQILREIRQHHGSPQITRAPATCTVLFSRQIKQLLPEDSCHGTFVTLHGSHKNAHFLRDNHVGGFVFTPLSI